MKLSKLDPMTALMLVVAFGVVVTMLTQNSVASVDTATVNANQIEEQAAAKMAVTTAQMRERNLEKKARHVSYDFSIDAKTTDAKNGSSTKSSKATFY